MPALLRTMTHAVVGTIQELAEDATKLNAEIERLRTACHPVEADLSRIRMRWVQDTRETKPADSLDYVPRAGFKAAPGALGVWRFDHGTWIRWLAPADGRP